MLFGVPLKPLLVVVGVSGVILTLYLTIQYIQQAERDKMLLEIQQETTTIREVIRNEILENKPVDRNDPTSGLQYFENRNSN